MKPTEYQNQLISEGKCILQNKSLLYLAMEVRTGKTLTALSIAEDYSNVIFITKKKAIQSIEDDYTVLAPPYNLTVINYESVHKVKGRFDLAIIDEAQALGAFPKPAKRVNKIKRLVFDLPVIYLSGTPSPESYSQLFHQFFVSRFSPFIEYRNFYQWARDFIDIKKKYIGSMQVNDYSHAKIGKIRRIIEPYFLTITQEDAGFKSLVEEYFINVPPISICATIAEDLKRDKASEFTFCGQTYQVILRSPADLINKLSQLAGGTIIPDGHEDGIIFGFNKMNEIATHFKGQKIAIFYKYRAEGDLIRQFLTLNGIPYTDNPEQFNQEDCTFVGQFLSCREGINLSGADALVCYNIDFSATTYFQVRARHQHINKKRPSPVYWINSGIIEKQVYKAVTKKKNFTYSYYKGY